MKPADVKERDDGISGKETDLLVDPDTDAAPEDTEAKEAETLRVFVPIGMACPGVDGLRHLMLDQLYRSGSIVVAVGWCTVPGLVPGLAHDGVPLNVELCAVRREDVANSYPKSGDGPVIDADTTGFALMALAPRGGSISLTYTDPSNPGTTRQIELDDPGILPMAPVHYSGAAPLLLPVMRSETVGSTAWNAVRDLIPVLRGTLPGSAKAHFDTCFMVADGLGAIASGWVVHSPDVAVWIEDDQGNKAVFDSDYRRPRPDVLNAFPDIGATSADLGFFVNVPKANPGSVIAIWAAGPEGLWQLSKTTGPGIAADAKEVARRLAMIETPINDLVRRAQAFDLKILASTLRLQRASWSKLKPQVVTHGTPPANPMMSIIVPLYGRSDFVEHQMIEFLDDPWLRANAEIIYVLDDPKLVEPFRGQADELWKVYELPFHWVWGHVNRGFSGANNLGAQTARGDFLVFMNSDVFPTEPGWLDTLKTTLEANPQIGAIAPRLLFADGGIQHAGMTSRWHDQLGIYINHHPMMGFDPSMDQRKGPVEVPLITGACVVIARPTYDAIGGWDTDYVIGDYEDSDLCYALHDKGLSVAYMPEVELVHLERQSFRFLGEDGFRLRVTLTNAARHQQRWGKFLPQGGPQPQ